ncbi:MAG: DEAD/DEAH box helicase family protein [Planctomycetes bacterium]|nr:DEAD/DEAH box helicase family protein [Planctomycetota bacterium]
MARRRASQSGTATPLPEASPLKFDQKLVLHQWMLSLFDGRTFEQLAEPLKPADLEGFDEDNNHKFLKQIRLLWQFEAFPGDILLGYEQNIVKHTLRLNERRAEPIRWKYFQWLSLLFTEVYLDRFFRAPERLLADLNQFVERFNADKLEKDRIPAYEPGDLRKIAFWNATGSGKTLLMHVNILQYQHYLTQEGRGREMNRIILLTPNEGLSRQHLAEFEAAGITAEIFSKDGASLFAGRTIEIIDIHKLREDMGEKTVAIDAFEGKNLVLVDEGHRGSSGKETGRWMDARRRLCEQGFSFEYSATFGQAMKASGNRPLEQEYAKCILFDYSYKYFYRDGFGKDYRILNLADDSDEDKRRLYLAACLLAFYQQQRLYRDKVAQFRPFLLENPLWVFVGGSVNAVRSENKRKVSDVVDILLFLAVFVKEKRHTTKLLDRLLSGKPGLHDQRGNEIFATAFGYIRQVGLSGEAAFDDILKVLFNSPVPAKLHVLNLKGTDGEIALRLGENEAFGLINVGDASALCKLCDQHPDDMVVDEKEFSGSLFAKLSEEDSTVNVLIGSKKFTEGWNSWRVSTMGLMNVGKSEGSEIIQLFGRGVRLKGWGMCLKRSGQIDGVPKPPHIDLLETLNIFGIRAQYMQQFKEYLEDEGLPSNEDRIEFILPVVKNLDGKKLKSIRLKEGMDFKRQGPKPTLDEPSKALLRHPVALNWYPKIQSQQSKGVASTSDIAVIETGVFEDKHLAFMDIDAIYFELQHFKNERSWHNLNLPRASIMKLLANPEWYRLYIPAAEMEFTRFDRVRRWEEIAVALLKKYIDRFYKHRKQEWEAEHLEYHEVREDDPNFVQEYRLLIDQSAEAIKTSLETLRDEIRKKTFSKDWSFGNLSAFWFGNHLYQPLLHLSKSQMIEVSPVTLNDGERDFVLDLRAFYDGNKGFFKDRELYLLRNVSKRGIGFFEAGNFYPDFILWLLVCRKQYVTFVDPKGLRQLDEGSLNPKVQFYRTIKEIETRLADTTVILNSFILSATPYQSIPMWGEGMTKGELRKCHVLFQRDDKDSYIRDMLDLALSNAPG